MLKARWSVKQYTEFWGQMRSDELPPGMTWENWICIGFSGMCTLADFYISIAEYPPEYVRHLYKDSSDKEQIFWGLTPYYRYDSMC